MELLVRVRWSRDENRAYVNLARLERKVSLLLQRTVVSNVNPWQRGGWTGLNARTRLAG